MDLEYRYDVRIEKYVVENGGYKLGVNWYALPSLPLGYYVHVSPSGFCTKSKFVETSQLLRWDEQVPTPEGQLCFNVSALRVGGPSGTIDLSKLDVGRKNYPLPLRLTGEKVAGHLHLVIEKAYATLPEDLYRKQKEKFEECTLKLANVRENGLDLANATSAEQTDYDLVLAAVEHKPSQMRFLRNISTESALIQKLTSRPKGRKPSLVVISKRYALAQNSSPYSIALVLATPLDDRLELTLVSL